MKILYIYRNDKMGPSIGKVFRAIEREVGERFYVDHFYLPKANYNPFSLWKNIRAVKEKLSSDEYDIIHITGTENYLIPFISKGKLVVTVHDLGFFTQSKKNLKLTVKYLLFIKTLEKADLLTFISKKSLEECMSLIEYSRQHTIIIHNPVGTEFCYTHKRINKDKPRVLHIGTKKNKNLENTILALRGMNCTLRIVGKIDEKIKELLESNDIKFSVAYNLTDNEIVDEYKNCDIVSFVSLYEGFGLPILEGQSVGRPVVTSDIEPMNEISGNAAVLVEPTNVESIKWGYYQALNRNEELIALGLKNVERYSLKEIAYKYIEQYELLMNLL